MKGTMFVPREVVLTHSTGLVKREKVLVMQFWPLLFICCSTDT